MTPKASYRLSRAAAQDLRLILRDGAVRFGREQTLAYVEGLVETLERLRDFPALGRSRPELGLIRSLPYRSHVVFYQDREEGEILVVRVRHGREDLPF